MKMTQTRFNSPFLSGVLHLFVDALILVGAFAFALPARFGGSPPPIFREALPGALKFVLPVYLLINVAFGLYQRIWRYAGAHDILPIIESVFLSTLVAVLIDIFGPGVRPLPVSAVLFGGFFALAGFILVRYRWRLAGAIVQRWSALGRIGDARALNAGRPRATAVARLRVLVVGAGEAGQLLVRRFQTQREGEGYDLIGFVDDDSYKAGLSVHGLPVFGDRLSIPNVVERHEIDLVVVAIYDISGPSFRQLLDICSRTPAVIKVVPNLFDFLSGTQGVPTIRAVTVEDLLGRSPAEIDVGACRKLIEGTTVLVTGASGSIGSELCRQIIGFGPRTLLALDNNESGLFDLMLELQVLQTRHGVQESHAAALVPIVGDVTNATRIDGVFDEYSPEVIFHAAAYKHVPLMEQHPHEAVRVNVLGTRIVGEAAARSGARRFVFVSTDKAVKPSSVMGASKRIGELLVAARHAGVDEQPTAFTAVRFGNVLGSRGSVVPTFERQIEQGGPVTVSDPEMTRYFMSTPEAVSLIIQAAVLTTGGDIFMLDMGERIRIDDLARRLIRLRGLRPDVDVAIVYTGARPGEKMHEELLDPDEIRDPTPHKHIFRVRSKEPLPSPRDLVERLIDAGAREDTGDLISILESLIGTRLAHPSHERL